MSAPAVVTTVPTWPMPALLTRMSSAPCLPSMVPARRPIAASSVTSSSTNSARPWSVRIAPATRCPFAESRSATYTSAPARANVWAIASPIPDPAPVTSAVLLSSLNMESDCTGDGSLARMRQEKVRRGAKVGSCSGLRCKARSAQSAWFDGTTHPRNRDGAPPTRCQRSLRSRRWFEAPAASDRHCDGPSRRSVCCHRVASRARCQQSAVASEQRVASRGAERSEALAVRCGVGPHAFAGVGPREATPKGERRVEAAGFAPASENTSPQEYYDAYPLLNCRPRREEAAKNRQGPTPENLIADV